MLYDNETRLHNKKMGAKYLRVSFVLRWGLPSEVVAHRARLILHVMSIFPPATLICFPLFSALRLCGAEKIECTVFDTSSKEAGWSCPKKVGNVVLLNMSFVDLPTYLGTVTWRESHTNLWGKYEESNQEGHRMYKLVFLWGMKIRWEKQRDEEEEEETKCFTHYGGVPEQVLGVALRCGHRRIFAIAKSERIKYKTGKRAWATSSRGRWIAELYLRVGIHHGLKQCRCV